MRRELLLICRRKSTLENKFLSDYSRYRQKWRMLTVFIPYPRPEPHIACTLVDETIGEDDRLLRTEMISALCLIRGRMRLKAYKDHQIIPVRFLTLRVND